MLKKKLVVLTGAGISAESGLKTFRDSDGLWEGYNVEDVATPRAWNRDPQLVLEFYNQRRRNIRDAEPNEGHLALARLESQFGVTIVTQNIDDLHERAGSTNVLHLHGEIFKMRSCLDSRLVYEIREDIIHGQTASDGAQLRPHIVWFEEPVPMIEKAIEIVESADLFAVVGTSLQVYPAAGLLNYVRNGVPVFIVDRRIPSIGLPAGYHSIEKPASTGVPELAHLLIERYL